jgi:hypothetical protein
MVSDTISAYQRSSFNYYCITNVESKSRSIVQQVNKTLKKTKEQFRETGTWLENGKLKKVFYFIVLFCVLQKIQFYTDVEQIAAIGIQRAESGHNTECSYVRSIVQQVNKTLKKTKEQFRETGNIGYTRHRTKTNKKKTTQKWTQYRM